MISIRTWLVLAIALAACELEPPPKPAPPAPPAPATAAAPATPAPPPPAPAPAPAPRPAPAAPVRPQNPACLAAAVHFTDVTIAAAKEPVRSQLEHDRTLIVKQTEDACVAQHWSQSAIDCFTHAATAAALHACDKQLAPAAPAAPHHDPVIEGHVTTGSGSGSGSGSGHSHHTRSHGHATHTTHSTR